MVVTTLAEAVKPKYGGKPPYYRFRPPERQFHGGKITDDNPDYFMCQQAARWPNVSSRTPAVME